MSQSKQTKYLEFDKRKSLEGSVWHHFLRAEDGQSGKCKLCSKILKCHGGATTGFHVHLKSIHCIDLKEKKNPLQSQPESSTSSTSTSMPTTTPAKKHKMMTDFFNSSKEMDEKVSRMAALDGLPFSKFCTSKDLRDLFHRCGYKLPESGTAIKRIVLNEFEKNKNQLRQNIAQDTTTRYSVTLDEYTSTRNRRYMNVNLHSDKFKDNFKNLGLVRIEGSMPAITALTYLKAHLKGFAVDLDKDVICLTTDGASVMIKMGRYYEGYHQICLAHGIQLGVTDVLYKKNSNEENNSNNDRTIDANIFEPEHQDEDGALEESSDDESEEFNSGFDIDIPTIETERELNFKETVEKIRKLVRSVRKSSLKNEAIQKYAREEFGKELNLVLDCKTRWSSLSDMIERFLKLKSCITKGFLDLDIVVPINEESMAILKELHESLNVIKITVESLCTREANLMTADTALKFMLKSLDSLNGSISNKLAQSLRKRIKERRLPLASVLTYLYDSEDYHEDNFDLGTFSKPTGEEMFTEIIKIIERLEKEERIPGEEEENSDCIEIVTNTENEKKDIKKELQQTIQNKLTVKSRRKTNVLDLESLIRVEMAVYENGGVRGQYLQKCFQYLKTIPPTSVEAERAFSVVTNICNRVRSSLNDDSLNALTFLKFHYKQKCT